MKFLSEDRVFALWISPVVFGTTFAIFSGALTVLFPPRDPGGLGLTGFPVFILLFGIFITLISLIFSWIMALPLLRYLERTALYQKQFVVLGTACTAGVIALCLGLTFFPCAFVAGALAGWCYWRIAEESDIGFEADLGRDEGSNNLEVAKFEKTFFFLRGARLSRSANAVLLGCAAAVGIIILLLILAT